MIIDHDKRERTKSMLTKDERNDTFSLNAAIGVFTFEVCRERLLYNIPSINIQFTSTKKFSGDCKNSHLLVYYDKAFYWESQVNFSA